MMDDLIARLREMSRQLVLSTDRGTCHEAAEALAAASRPQQDLSNHHNALACPYCNPMKLELFGRESAPPAAPPPWQPISTAPKDGTLVLLANATDVDWPMRCRRWVDGHWRGHDADDATHWLALPSPPASTRPFSELREQMSPEAQQRAKDRADEILAASPPASAPQQEQVAVAGRLERTLADFERACLVHLEEEQQRVSPDNALIALLCDAVRLKREHIELWRASAPAPQEETRVCEHCGQPDPEEDHYDAWLDYCDGSDRDGWTCEAAPQEEQP